MSGVDKDGKGKKISIFLHPPPKKKTLEGKQKKQLYINRSGDWATYHHT